MQAISAPRNVHRPSGSADFSHLTHFEITDEEGRGLPILTRQQSRRLSESMLINGAQMVAALAEGVSGIRLAGRMVTAEVVAQVSASFARLRAELEESFFLLAMVRGEPGDRRVIRYTYEDAPTPLLVPPRQREDIVREFLRYLGVRGRPVLLHCPAASYGHSYHVEIELPDELFFEHGRLIESPIGTGEIVLASQKNVARLHLHPERYPESTNVRLMAAVRLCADGLLISSLMVDALAVGLFVAALVLRCLGAITTDGEIVASLLLALPAILGAYLFRPGEHKLVAKAAAGVRATLRLLTSSPSAVLGCWRSNYPLAFPLVDRAHVCRHRPDPAESGRLVTKHLRCLGEASCRFVMG